MKKALMLATVASMIDLFNMDNISILRNLNYSVSIVCNFEVGSSTSQERVREFREELLQMNLLPYHIPIPRKLFNIKDIFASYKQIKNIVMQDHYDIIHCHSPIGGAIARLACRNVRKKGTKVIYTAHGFHFYKGAPLINWLLYYPAEKWLSKYTDVLITINKEDYECAKNKFKAACVEYVPGVGVDIDKFQNIHVDKEKKRSSIGVKADDFMIISVGELNKNKNHRVVIEAISKFKNKKIKYVICGQGPLEKELMKIAEKLGVEDQVKFLGFRKDISELYKVSDLFAFPSFREGLSLALMEAMASGLTVICSKIRGNIDLIEENKNGYLVSPNDVNAFERKIKKLIDNDLLRQKMGESNICSVNQYSLQEIEKRMKFIYGLSKGGM